MTVRKQSERGLVASIVLLFGLMILTGNYPPAFLAVLAALAASAWWVTRIRCPKCRRPAWLREYEGKIYLKMWRYPPEFCQRCGWSFDREYEDRRPQRKA